jgi:rhamnosyltransferase subunit B
MIMARIVISTFGSSGGINPFLSLGIALRSRGHEVIFAVEENGKPAIVEAGFPVSILTGEGFGGLDLYNSQLFGGTTPITSFMVIVKHWILSSLQQKIEELRAICSNSDLLVARAGNLAAPIVSELVGIPWIYVTLTPFTVPSTYFQPHPFPLPLPSSVQRLANRVAWSLAVTALSKIVDKPVNRIRNSYRLTPNRNVMSIGHLSTVYNSVAVSESFFQPPPDWPSSVHMTGFCFWDTPKNWEEPTELTAFLTGPEPVIAVSSGSMAWMVKQEFSRFFEASIEAIGRVGAKALVIGAASNTLTKPLPKYVMAIPFAPFSQVYPRCAVAVHHAGPGTTAQALRAGIPSLALPWGLEQFFTAAQIERKSVGLWMNRAPYTAKRAALMLQSLLYDRAYQAHVEFIASQIRQEDGADTNSLWR